jgi:transketolase
MRAVHGSTVLYPADGNSTVKLTQAMSQLPGIVFMRTTREKTPRLYGPEEEFLVGGSKTLRTGDQDRATLVGAGVTLVQALAAADELANDGISVRVIDAYSVKPIDGATLREALDQTGLVVTVEDHWVQGGLGDAVLEALVEGGRQLSGRVLKIGVTEMPGSGSPEELRDWAGISGAKIAAAVRDALDRTSERG